MTPLIDVVFILLLFFILETRFSEFRSLWLPLPAPPPALAGEAPRALRIEVFADGRLWVAGTTLPQPGLAAFLQTGAYRSDTPVVLATEPAVVLQTLVELCDVLRAHGLGQIDIRGLDGD